MASDQDKKQEDKNSPEKPQKSQLIILQQTEEEALTQIERNATGLILSGISAGLDLGFSVLLMTVVVSSFTGVVREPVLMFFVSLAYPIGFIFIILGRSELFTEHTALAVLPVLQGLASVKKLLRLWAIVYAGNIIGGLIIAFVLSYLGGSMGFLHGWALDKIAVKMVGYTWLTKFFTAILAGWLMGLLAWLVAASKETISQLMLIFLVTATIGFVGLPHCIAGNIEVAAGMFDGKVSFMQYLWFLVPVTVGNALGGILFVAVIKFNHTVNSGEEKNIELDAEGKVKE